MKLTKIVVILAVIAGIILCCLVLTLFTFWLVWGG